MVLFPEGLKALKQVAKAVGVDLRGAYLNLDGSFESVFENSLLHVCNTSLDHAVHPGSCPALLLP
jgi:hypothetical protein